MKLKYAILSLIFVAIFVPLLVAGNVNAPGPSIPVPPGTWVKVLTRDLPVQTNDWEQLVYVGPLQRSVMLSQYHQTNSEPNESIVGYNFDTNSWDLLDMGGLFHTENMPEGGESQGYFDYNPNNATIEYHCCTTGSNQAENVYHTWWFDVLGQSGRDEQTPIEPLSLQPGGAFDVAHNVAVMYGGASYVGTWIYDPVANSWQAKATAGNAPDPSVILPDMVYSSAAQKVFLYGGRNGSATTYYSDLYSYDVPSNTWSLISPAGGVKPPARCCMNFAYDSTNNIFLLYGGKNASGVLGDTWAYDPTANTWTLLNSPVSPAINTVSDFTRLAYDADHNVFVLAHLGAGGYFGGSWTSLSFQTWLFRYAGAGPNAATLLNSTQPAAGSLSRNLQSWAKDPALAASGNSLYVSWAETGSPFVSGQSAWPHIFADQYSGGNWANMGIYSSISGGAYEAHAPSLAVVGATPWVSWYQNVNRVPQVYAASWNGSAWLGGPIGLVGTSSVQGRSMLASVAGTPYIGFIEVNKSVSPQSAYAYVKSFNGTSWSVVGTGALNIRPAAGSTATSISIASDGVNPYAAWTEYFRTTSAPGGGGVSTTNPQVHVSYWNGSQWTAVGGSLNVSSTGWANDVSIAYFGGQLYAAWTERTQTGNNQLYVATWNGTAWTLTGAGSLNQGGANGWAYRPSLMADPTGTNLYLAWVEQTALGHKAQVFVAQLVAGSWSTLGQPLNVDPVNGSAQRVSLGVLNGQPVAAWSEVNLGTVRGIYAAQWNGSSWTQLPANPVKDTTAPTKPASLTATVASSSQINLAWSPSTDIVGVNGYFVYRNGIQVGNVSATLSYQDTGLNPATTYTYTVAAYDAASNISVQSPKVAATTVSGSPNPAVSFNAPTSGANLSGTLILSANATDNVGIANVQFQLDGTNLGSPITSGPIYSMSWNTTAFANGAHTLTAIATDTVGLTATSSEPVTINNFTIVEPEISAVSASAITSSGATITWTTDEGSSSQVQYGTTTAYGSSTPVNTALVSSHSVPLSGLQTSTTYHYIVISQDGAGNLNASADNVFTTSAPGLQTFLQIQGSTSEVSGVTKGSTVTPTTAPTGFTGTVVANGTGSVKFISGNGVYFLNCCVNTNNTYFKFSGASIGNIFNATQGQVSFSLQSRYTYSQRKSTASTARYAFDARDGSGKHQFYFLTQVTGQGLQFSYLVGGVVHNYFVPGGTEDTLFGNGVTLQVTIGWGQTGSILYLNGSPVQSSSYAAPSPNWTSASILDLGAFEYSTYGGYNVSDDVILNFTLAGVAQ